MGVLGVAPEVGFPPLPGARCAPQASEASKTPRAVFVSFASGSDTDAVIPREGFEHLIVVLGGRSPAAAGAADLFDELAVTVGDRRGVPYDLFCVELCVGSAPDAALRLDGKRRQAINDLRAAFPVAAHELGFGRSMQDGDAGSGDFAGRVVAFFGFSQRGSARERKDTDRYIHSLTPCWL